MHNIQRRRKRRGRGGGGGGPKLETEADEKRSNQKDTINDRMITQMYILTHILSSKEDKTTETDEAAIAAEPIQG